MRRLRALIFTPFVAVLAIGCGAETPPPLLEAAQVAESPRADAAAPKVSSKVAFKKKKERGISAVPTTSKSPRSTL